jgi:beta-glucosidase-like glycosyl hydrolase
MNDRQERYILISQRYNKPMLNYYQFIVPRLDGVEIKKRFSYYRSLVRKGVAGFIVFGGELETVRAYINKLQDEAELPLIIASDLERGLGQQLKGGTHFPPAMALAATVQQRRGQKAEALRRLARVRKAFTAVAGEAKYAGINTIFAPVLDINTNPDNPIIAARAFGEDPATVSLFGTEMIQAFQRNGVAACAKHFPGHGDTSIDSHIQLPVLKQDMKRLRRYELKPFRKAIASGVRMIMLGHLNVPALDPLGIPVSFSKEAVHFLRRDMGYNGLLITDALNMGGIGKYSEEEASLMALEAGIDILLHPSDPERTASFLKRKKVLADPARLLGFRKGLAPEEDREEPDFEMHRRLSEKLTAASITCKGKALMKGTPLLVILNDEQEEKGLVFAHIMEKQFPGMRVFRLSPGSVPVRVRKGENEFMIIAIFSETKAWKGGASSWLFRKLSSFRAHADLFISFGSPYLLRDLGNTSVIMAYWDADQAQKAAAEVIKKMLHERLIILYNSDTNIVA